MELLIFLFLASLQMLLITNCFRFFHLSFSPGPFSISVPVPSLGKRYRQCTGRKVENEGVEGPVFGCWWRKTITTAGSSSSSSLILFLGLSSSLFFSVFIGSFSCTFFLDVIVGDDTTILQLRQDKKEGPLGWKIYFSLLYFYDNLETFIMRHNSQKSFTSQSHKRQYWENVNWS